MQKFYILILDYYFWVTFIAVANVFIRVADREKNVGM